MGVTVNHIISELTKRNSSIENTVDTLKFGNPDKEVSSIAVSFMPTYDVIKQAIAVGADLLICHEGIFHSHTDEVGSSANHVQKEKYKLICESGIAIYRFHDYFHRYKTDGIMAGMIKALEWETYIEENLPTETIVTIPEMSVKEVINHIKKKLGIGYGRYVGDLSMNCKKISLLVGYRGGGKIVIPTFEERKVDLVIYGEGPEWETPEYVRDALAQGNSKALIILGHLESEEPGMKYLATLMQNMFPFIPVHFISTDQCIKFL